MRRQIVAGNWKMNGSKELVQQIIGQVCSQLADVEPEVVVVPPAPYISGVVSLAAGGLSVGAQNVSQWRAGAYTGEVSAEMAADLGCEFVLAGHSERRQLFGETDDVVAAKVECVLEQGLVAVVCVGETLDERNAGRAREVVSRQVRCGLVRVSAGQWRQVVVAYEPVWAIGTGKTATASDAQSMHASIRAVLKELGAPSEELSILYGGSVKADNAAALFAEPDVDGGLIGGASLKAEEFLSICRAIPANV